MTPGFCLALALFFEARSEPMIGWLAVGQVILTRVESHAWPDTICKVVWQDKQFSFTHDGKTDNPNKFKAKADKIAWKRAQVLANMMIDTPMLYDPSEGADHYHNDTVNPYWNTTYKHTTTIGKHLFYKRVLM